MIEVLRDHITNRLGKDPDNLVLGNFKHIKTKRNEQLVKQGEVCKYIYFIAKGCLQVYVYDKDFNETTPPRCSLTSAQVICNSAIRS